MQSQITEWSTALMTSLAAAMAMFFSSIPKIIGFAVILIVGWLIAAVIEKAVAALLRTVKFNELSQRSGFSDFVHKMGTQGDSSGMIAMVVKWFVRLVALVSVARRAGNGFALTRRELAQDWRDIKERL